MNVLEEIQALLDPETGLRCLPPFLKAAYWEMFQIMAVQTIGVSEEIELASESEPVLTEEQQARLAAYLAWYRTERLGVLEQFVEPLTQPPASGEFLNPARNQFLQLATKLPSIKSAEPFAALLQRELPEELAVMTWLEWARQLEMNPGACLIPLASFWSAPQPVGSEIEVMVLCSLAQTCGSSPNRVMRWRCSTLGWGFCQRPTPTPPRWSRRSPTTRNSTQSTPR